MSQVAYCSLGKGYPWKSTLALRTYTGEQLVVVGEVSVEVQYQDQTKHLPLLIVEGEGPTFLGQNWLQELRLDWREINSLSTG